MSTVFSPSPASVGISPAATAEKGTYRAEARLWDLARTDPRLTAVLMLARAREAELAEELNHSPVAAKNDYADALAPMGLDTGFSAPLRRWAQMEVRRQTGYLPYL